MSNLEKCGRFTICLSADRAPISFPRVPEEVVCLGFDPESEGLAELHVLSVGEDYNDRQRLSFIERAWNAASLSGPCFQQIIDVEEFEGMLLYATTVNDGEFLSDFLIRKGPLDRSVATSLMIDLTEAVLQLQPHYRLLLGLNLKNLMVVLTEASLLTLRIIDLGLSKPDAGRMDDFDPASIVADLARTYYYMLGGKLWMEGRSGQIANLQGIPADVKVLLRNALRPSEAGHSQSLEGFYQSLCSVRNEAQPRRSGISTAGPLAVPATLHPRFLLRKTLFGKLQLEEVVSAGYELDLEDRRGVYSFGANQAKDGRDVLIQLLPPSSALPLEASSQVASEMSRIDLERHPALIKPLGFIEEERVAFIVEEALNGFSLPQLLAARDYRLDPAECFIILEKVQEALSQAEDAEVTFRNLTIHSVTIHFPTEPARRLRELMIRRADHWPQYQIKVRCHPTVRSLISQAPSGRIETGRQREPVLSENARLAKGFVGIAESLLIGPWPAPPVNSGEAESSSRSKLRQFFRDAYRNLNQESASLNRAVFLSSLRRQPAIVEEMEVEISGTITDGGITPPSPSPDLNPESDSGSLNSPLADAEDGTTESLGTIDAEEFDLPEAESSLTPSNKKRFPW